MCWSLSLSLSLYFSIEFTVIHMINYRRDSSPLFGLISRLSHFNFSLSLSLSHSHTHTLSLSLSRYFSIEFTVIHMINYRRDSSPLFGLISRLSHFNFSLSLSLSLTLSLSLSLSRYFSIEFTVIHMINYRRDSSPLFGLISRLSHFNFSLSLSLSLAHSLSLSLSLAI